MERGAAQGLVVRERECNHSAGGHAAERRVTRLRCAHEDRQKALMSAGGEAASPRLRERDRAVRSRRPLRHCELVVRDRGCEDRCSLDRPSVTRLDHDADPDRVRRAGQGRRERGAGDLQALGRNERGDRDRPRSVWAAARRHDRRRRGRRRATAVGVSRRYRHAERVAHVGARDGVDPRSCASDRDARPKARRPNALRREDSGSSALDRPRRRLGPRAPRTGRLGAQLSSSRGDDPLERSCEPSGPSSC